MTTSVIAFAGRKGAGKDTAGDVFVEQGYAREKFAGELKAMLRAYLRTAEIRLPAAAVDRMIDGDLKEQASWALTPAGLSTDWAASAMLRRLARYRGEDTSQIERLEAGHRTLLGVSYDSMRIPLHSWARGLGDPGQNLSPRYVMQQLGTEWGRKMIYPDFWVDGLRARIKHLVCVGHKKIVITDARFQNEVDMILATPGGRTWRIYRPGRTASDMHASEAGIDGLTGVIDLRNDFRTAEQFANAVRHVFFPTSTDC